MSDNRTRVYISEILKWYAKIVFEQKENMLNPKDVVYLASLLDDFLEQNYAGDNYLSADDLEFILKNANEIRFICRKVLGEYCINIEDELEKEINCIRKILREKYPKLLKVFDKIEYLWEYPEYEEIPFVCFMTEESKDLKIMEYWLVLKRELEKINYDVRSLIIAIDKIMYMLHQFGLVERGLDISLDDIYYILTNLSTGEYKNYREAWKEIEELRLSIF